MEEKLAKYRLNKNKEKEKAKSLFPIEKVLESLKGYSVSPIYLKNG